MTLAYTHTTFPYCARRTANATFEIQEVEGTEDHNEERSVRVETSRSTWDGYCLKHSLRSPPRFLHPPPTLHQHHGPPPPVIQRLNHIPPALHPFHPILVVMKFSSHIVKGTFVGGLAEERGILSPLSFK